MYNRLLKGILILGVLMALMASLSSAATCPWFIRGELYTAQCGVIKEVPESQGLLANDPQALEVLDPELITIDPKYGSIKVAANGSFIYSPSPNIRQGTYVWFKYNATNGKCKSLYPAIAKFQIRCSCRPNIPIIDPICLPTTLGEIRDILTEAEAGCYGCGDVSPIIDLSRIRVDKNGNPIAGTYSFCVKCPGCKEQCGQLTLIDCANDHPVANDDTFNTIEDTPVKGSVAGNDIPSKDGGNVWSKETDPGHGTVLFNSDGTFTYTPEEGYCGTDKFTYTLKDIDGDSDTATVTINIECINDLPVANDDTFNTIEDTPVTGSVAGNDIPSKDGGNVWSKETDPEHGTVLFNSDGTFTYTPEEGYCGTDKFTYTLKDIDGDSDTATVTINIECVNDLPVANDDTFNTIEDTPVKGSVAGNDIPSKDGGNVWSKETDPEHGTVLFNSDGTFTYTPEEGYCGTDKFTYTLKDIDGDFDSATVTINIECINHIPVANDDTFNTIEDTPVKGSVAGNDIPSKDGGNVWSKETDPEHGTVLLNSDGTFTYTPEEGYCGTDKFTYTLKDIDGDFDSATVTINIECVNGIPVASDDSARICQDRTLCSSVADNDILSKDGENTWSLLSNPAHGTAVVDSDGTYCYTPIEGWSGIDCFTYQLCDIDNDCSQGTVTITVVEKCNCDLISFSQDGCMYPDELEDLIKDVNAYVCAECDDTPEWSFPEWPVDQTTGYVMGGEYTFSVTCHAGGEELENCDSTCEGVILCTCQPAVCPCEAYAEDIIVGCGVSKEDLSALVVADCQDKGDYACDQTPVIDLSGVITDPSTGFVTGGCYTVDCSPSWVECPTARGDVIVECNDIAHAPDICLPIVCVERSGKLSCRDYSLPLYSAALKQMVTAAGGGCADKCSKMSVVLPENINWGIPGLYQYKVVCKDAKGVIIASDTGRLILDDNCGCGPCGCSGFC